MVPPDWNHPMEEIDGQLDHIPLLERYPDDDIPESEAKYYMPDWPAEICTHYQMYQNTSEGTPISPPMETPEQLARWLADNDASALGDETATYEEWLLVCQEGSAPSMARVGFKVMNGDSAMSELANRKPFWVRFTKGLVYVTIGVGVLYFIFRYII